MLLNKYKNNKYYKNKSIANIIKQNFCNANVLQYKFSRSKNYFLNIENNKFKINFIVSSITIYKYRIY